MKLVKVAVEPSCIGLTVCKGKTVETEARAENSVSNSVVVSSVKHLFFFAHGKEVLVLARSHKWLDYNKVQHKVKHVPKHCCTNREYYRVCPVCLRSILMHPGLKVVKSKTINYMQELVW